MFIQYSFTEVVNKFLESKECLQNFIETLETNPETKFILAYIAKSTGFVKADEFVFEPDQQFAFESIFY